MNAICSPTRYQWTGKVKRIIDYDGLGFPYEWQEKIYEPLPRPELNIEGWLSPFDIIAVANEIVESVWSRRK